MRSIHRLAGGVAITAVLVLLACSSDETAPKTVEKSPDTLEVERLSARAEATVMGREVFLSTCNRCHAHPEIWTTADTDWGPVRMRKYSDLEWTELLRDRDHHQIIDVYRRWDVYQYVTSG